MNTPTKFEYSPWRHGGWYVHNVRYPSGAIGCVSRNYPDKKWRVVCDPRGFEKQPTFKTRDEAARAEWELVNARTKRVIAAFTVDIGKTGENWTKEDIALMLDCYADERGVKLSGEVNATVWDSLEDFLADLKEGHTP
jgi:hypothetical protein